MIRKRTALSVLLLGLAGMPAIACSASAMLDTIRDQQDSEAYETVRDVILDESMSDPWDTDWAVDTAVGTVIFENSVAGGHRTQVDLTEADRVRELLDQTTRTHGWDGAYHQKSPWHSDSVPCPPTCVWATVRTHAKRHGDEAERWTRDWLNANKPWYVPSGPGGAGPTPAEPAGEPETILHHAG